jgi:hypothetical protein
LRHVWSWRRRGFRKNNSLPRIFYCTLRNQFIHPECPALTNCALQVFFDTPWTRGIKISTDLKLELTTNDKQNVYVSNSTETNSTETKGTDRETQTTLEQEQSLSDILDNFCEDNE